MVNTLYHLIIGMCLLPALLFGFGDDSEIYVSSSIDSYSAYENHPLTGTVSVTHDQKNKVEVSSFLLDSKPVQVEFIKDVRISSNSPLVISYYQFKMPGQAAGLYVLPEVTVKIGGKEYHSIMSSYEVKAGTTSPPSSSPSKNAGSQTPPQATTPLVPSKSTPVAKPILKLEALVESEKPLYPGQKTKFIYRYFYNTNMSLSREQLPLLDARGFLKYGDKQSKSYTQDGLSVSEVSQAVEAVKPGSYSFGPSIIEGYPYTQTAGGQPVYSSSKLSSEAPVVTATVLAFPEAGKPASFNGAMGEFHLKTSLASSPSMPVGDEAILSVTISGNGDLESALLPDLSQQPGFSGFFRMSDLPPVGKIDDNTKHFEVSLRPITSEISEIPSVEFSSFDPETAHYVTVKSKPISISVSPAGAIPSEDKGGLKTLPKPKNQVQAKTYEPDPIEVQSNFKLQTTDLYNKIFGTWWVFAIIPFGLAILIYETTLRDYLDKVNKEVRSKTSAVLYQDFLQQPKGSPGYFDLLNQVLKQKLAETGHAELSDTVSEAVPDDEIGGLVRAFFKKIEKSRFAGTTELNFEELEAEFRSLIDQIGKEAVESVMPKGEGNQ